MNGYMYCPNCHSAANVDRIGNVVEDGTTIAKTEGFTYGNGHVYNSTQWTTSSTRVANMLRLGYPIYTWPWAPIFFAGGLIYGFVIPPLLPNPILAHGAFASDSSLLGVLASYGLNLITFVPFIDAFWATLAWFAIWLTFTSDRTRWKRNRITYANCGFCYYCEQCIDHEGRAWQPDELFARIFN